MCIIVSEEHINSFIRAEPAAFLKRCYPRNFPDAFLHRCEYCKSRTATCSHAAMVVWRIACPYSCNFDTKSVHHILMNSAISCTGYRNIQNNNLLLRDTGGFASKPLQPTLPIRNEPYFYKHRRMKYELIIMMILCYITTAWRSVS